MDLKCIEWTNLNRSARDVKTNKDKQKKKRDKNAPADPERTDLYLTHIAGDYKSENLASLSSNQIINIYDQSNLKLKSEIKPTHVLNGSNKSINEIGFFKLNNTMIFSCADDGLLNCWDMRSNSTAICFDFAKNSREYLTADINSDDTLLCVGTNKNIDDALVCLYDIRVCDKYLYKFSESHSMDLSQIKFNPNKPRKFCSASVDGLVCLYDLDQKPDEEDMMKNDTNEDDSISAKKDSSSSSEEESDDGEEDPDFMEQVFNTDSSVQKIGYLYSNPDSSTDPDQLYAITFTNELFVWDLNTHDQIYKKSNNKKNTEEEDYEDYFFDCFYYKNKSNKYVLTSFMGDNLGNIRIYQEDELMYDSENFKKSADIDSRRKHRDVVRSSFLNPCNNKEFFTAGEDGFILKWNISCDTENGTDLKKGSNKTNKRRENDSDSDENEDKSPRKPHKKINKKFSNKK